MLRIIWSSVPCPVVPHFFHTFSQTARFSGEKILRNIQGVWLSLRLLSRTFLIRRKTEPDTAIKCAYVFRYSTTSCLSDFNKLEFSGQIVKKTEISNYMPSCSKWTNKQTDRQTEMTKLIVTFHNFSKRQKIKNVVYHKHRNALRGHKHRPMRYTSRGKMILGNVAVEVKFN